MSETQAAKRKQRKRKLPPPYQPGAPYMTRSQMPAYLAATHGVPVKLSSLDKLAMTGRLRADKFFGNHHLYTPKTAAKLASELLSDSPKNLQLDPPEAA